MKVVRFLKGSMLFEINNTTSFVKKPSVIGLNSLNWMSHCCWFQNSMIIYGWNFLVFQG